MAYILIHRLDGRHVVFGKVIEGMDVIHKMVACGSEVSDLQCHWFKLLCVSQHGLVQKGKEVKIVDCGQLS